MNLEIQYLVHSYIYYILSGSVIPDCHFDLICRQLLEEIERGYVPKYPDLIEREALQAGTGYQIPRDKYPITVIEAAYELLHG